MNLLERDLYLEILSKKYYRAKQGDGNTVFLVGEAGIGKTSVINIFTKQIENGAVIFGACDSLFTPRPLGPLYDIAAELDSGLLKLLQEEKERAVIFASFWSKILSLTTPTIIVIEDIHWADEATIDFIKFLARRISRVNCLFILTYRDDEIHSRHPLKSIFGELQPDGYIKLLINRLSKEAVNTLSLAKGYSSGEAVFKLTGGNPFYVNEILASYSLGIPDRVKDSVLTVFRAATEKTQELWEFLSIFPSGIELHMVEKLDIDFPNGIDHCINSGIIINQKDHFSFKHELFRLAIEESLSLHKRKSFHNRVLAILVNDPDTRSDWSRIVHHAKFAGEKKIVLEFAPKAAHKAAQIGSHMEAVKLYQIAIEYADKDEDGICLMYELYARECYLSNQFDLAIDSLENVIALAFNNDQAKRGNVLRLLSRLWFLKGDLEKAVTLGLNAVDAFGASALKQNAKAYSNLAQLFMIADESDTGIAWGEKAIEISRANNENGVLVHALSSVGSMLMKSKSLQQGMDSLKAAILLAKESNEHAQAARAYSILFSTLVELNEYGLARNLYHEAIQFCTDHDFTSWVNFITYWNAKMQFDTGYWSEAEDTALKLQNNDQQIVKIGSLIILARLDARRGNFESTRLLINRIKKLVTPLNDARFIAPMLATELEFSWIKDQLNLLSEQSQVLIKGFLPVKKHSCYISELRYWVAISGLSFRSEFRFEDDDLPFLKTGKDAVTYWRKLERSYEEALALLGGGDTSGKEALRILDTLGAKAVHKKIQSNLRSSGVRNVPRGLRESTRNNPVHLTIRQIEVLRMLKDGFQNNEIAEKLFVTPKTVEQHVTAILSKLEVNTRMKAVVEAQKRGFL